jgi:endonuclease G
VGEFLPSTTFDLAPDTLFVCDPAEGGLDYALVAVATRARPDSQRPDANLAEFGFNVLVREEGKLLKGELIHSIHHPEGQPRQVSLRENRLMALLEHWLHYETDTEQGSSGAPLYNNQWQVVGIHHLGVEKRDDQGRVLALGGGLWSPAMGERQKWWYANEGLRISRFITHVEMKVRAVVEANAPPVGECTVTEVGYSLFEWMLKPSPPAVPQNTPEVLASNQGRLYKPE